MIKLNRRAQKSTFGFALLLIVFVVYLFLAATIEPFKETLDEVRGTSSLNCPGTTGHNATQYNQDSNSTINKLTRRPTCFITGIGMVWFIAAVSYATISWLVANWRKLGK